MLHYLKYLTKKTGLPPGTPTLVEPSKQDAVIIEKIIYDSHSSDMFSISNEHELTIDEHHSKITWIDIRGIHDLSLIKTIGKKFKFHDLLLEDITNTTQLPKVEFDQNHIIIVIKAITYEKEELNLEHIVLFFSSKHVVAFQENTTDTFSVIKTRIFEKKGRITEKGTDYLVYALFDYVIDTYFNTLRKIDIRLSELNAEVDQHPSQETLKNIQTTKKNILILKRYFWYIRDIILTLKKSETSLISEQMNKYLTDLYDHVAHIIDISESFREELIDLSERHLSNINLRSNDIMKTLTIVSVVFIPLTFLAGIYGMNFKVMPELHWTWSYPSLLGVMILIVISLLVVFKKRKWFD